MTDQAATPPFPVPSSTILLLRERACMEVLMVKRGEGAHFGSALVFPGGKLDRSDLEPHWNDHVEGGEDLDPHDRGLRIAGWREVFEETGLLPGPCIGGLADGDREGDFLDLVRRSGARLPLSDMRPFARWITPEIAPKRFDVNFYLCALDGEDAVCDGFETVSAEWVTPGRAIEMGDTGEHKLLFPTRCQLHRLAMSETIERAIAAAAAQPIVTITPRVETRAEGTFVSIPPDAGYAYFEEPLT